MDAAHSPDYMLSGKAHVERYKKELQTAEQKIDNANKSNREISLKYYEMNQIGKLVAGDLGFKTLFEAHAAISRDRGTFNYGNFLHQVDLAQKQREELENQRRIISEIRDAYGQLYEVLRQTRSDNDVLREQVGVHQNLPTDSKPPVLETDNDWVRKPTQFQHLLGTDGESTAHACLELSNLQERYDALLQAKKVAAEKHKKDYKKWRDFKREINLRGKRKGSSKEDIDKRTPLQNTTHGSGKTIATSINSSAGVSAKGKENDEHTIDTTGHVRLSVSSTSIDRPFRGLCRIPKALSDSRPCMTTGTDHSAWTLDRSLKPLKRKWSDDDDSHAPHSETEDDSQAPQSTGPHKSASTHQAIGRGIKTRDRRHDSTFIFKTPTVLKIETKEKAHSTEERELRSSNIMGNSDYSEFKGRGRYAQSSGVDNSINAQYEIDRSRNGGLDYQFDSIVRSKEERRNLIAGDCECCRDYYEAIHPLPPRSRQPLWRSPNSSPNASRTACVRHAERPPDVTSASSSNMHREQIIEQHQKDISRHRYDWERPSTPPGYWNIGFPSTQEASKINVEAKEMHQKKLEAVEQEVDKSYSRFKKR